MTSPAWNDAFHAACAADALITQATMHRVPRRGYDGLSLRDEISLGKHVNTARVVQVV